MEELIFFGVLILFSILDAIAKRKRQKEQGEVEAPEPDGWEGVEGRPWEAPGAGGPEAPRPAGTRSQPDRGVPSTSEGMVPRDLWEEIGALARGELPAEPEAVEEAIPHNEWAEEETPERLPSRIPSTSPIRRGQVGAQEVGRRWEVGEHPIHRSHAEYGTDPSERTPVPPPGRRGPSAEVREVRRALVEGGASEARKAVILHEVLGKPLAYRDSTWTNTGDS